MTASPGPFVAFVQRGRRYAVPAAAVERVMEVPHRVRLPACGPASAIDAAVLVRNTLVPVVSALRPDTVVSALRPDAPGAIQPSDPAAILVIVATGDERCAIAASAVPAIVQSLSGDDIELLDPARLLPREDQPRRRPPTARALARAATVPRLVAGAAGPGRVLHLQLGADTRSVREADLEGIGRIEDVVPVPGAPAAGVGAMPWAGQAIPVLPAGADRASAVVVVAPTGGVFGFEVDRVLGWTPPSGGAAPLDLVALYAAAGLRPAPARHTVRPMQEDRARAQFLTVVIGGRRFALPLRQVRQVLAPAPVTRLPDAPSRAALGVRAWAGRVIPISRAERWVGLPEAVEAEDACHVLLDDGAREHVLRVDRVGELLTLDPSVIRPPHAAGPHAAAVARMRGEEHLVILDVARLITASGAP